METLRLLSFFVAHYYRYYHQSSSSSLSFWEGEKSLHYWFSIVLIQGLFQLSLCDLKQCTLVCKSISKLVRDYIQHNFWFQQHDNLSIIFEKRYLWYSPLHYKNVKNISTLPINTTKIQFFLTCDSLLHFPLTLQQVTHIGFGYLFNQPIGCGIKSEINNLPLTLTHLEFPTFFDDDFIRLSQYNQSVDDLPPKLTNLILSFYFNKPLNHLPPKLTHLGLPENFSQPINKLPLSLTHLTFTVFHQGNLKHPLNQLQRNFESNLECLILSPGFVSRYNSHLDDLYLSPIPPNFIRKNNRYPRQIVYKKKPQQHSE